VKRKYLIASAIIVTVGLIGFYFFNKYFKLVDLSTISVSTDDKFSKSKIKIKRGFYSINRANDQELFSSKNGDRTVYDGMQSGFLKTDYGENDFLITYDDKYYFQFRHFIFNSNNQHSYDFNLFRHQDTIYIKANIKGKDKMQFTRPMNLITDSKLLRCNVPIDSSKVIHNMTELKDR
jgi:hypothetical protein